ncbi:PREDICTED: LOW QUALITY PROTEIN: uncharacterized protein LOC108551693 [Eufriesea mexicana]|uniref:LOW QUALITY PROTEIN: uncharacterized protein LOC108551693 n=1 Tax=Eufriesea mexicana TaxID=516756 RepID=UPI00083BD4E4|nr:PREDICTED: LOW QUALITY PROTEIN: uncharacterized protein LOC108551693 [Eufriesea mexicana]
MIQLLAANRGLPSRGLREIGAHPCPNDTKVALRRLKRVTEAEPTFASAWNRATRPDRGKGIITFLTDRMSLLADSGTDGVFTRFRIMQRRDTYTSRSKWRIIPYMGKANSLASRACNNGLCAENGTV